MNEEENNKNEVLSQLGTLISLVSEGKLYLKHSYYYNQLDKGLFIELKPYQDNQMRLRVQRYDLTKKTLEKKASDLIEREYILHFPV
jgi:CTP-dependent riboflavin kinase